MCSPAEGPACFSKTGGFPATRNMVHSIVNQRPNPNMIVLLNQEFRF